MTRNKLVGSAAKLSRRAIAEFVDSNVPRFNKWLAKVAEGIPKVDAEGQPLRDAAGSVIWVNKPNPEAAIKLVADICEYHLPKLSRSDVAIAAQVEHSHLLPKEMNSEQLQRALLEQFGIGQQPEGEIIDVEAVPVPVDTPDWLK